MITGTMTVKTYLVTAGDLKRAMKAMRVNESLAKMSSLKEETRERCRIDASAQRSLLELLGFELKEDDEGLSVLAPEEA